MQNNNQAIVVSYYLSRFKDSYINLGYETLTETFKDLSEKFQVKTNTIRLWRDEFDPFHGHRLGWHKRKPSNHIIDIIRQFQQLEENELRQIVLEIISSKKIEHLIVDNLDTTEDSKVIFSTRGLTGKKAEDIFIKYHKDHNQPIAGDLTDTRDLGCGYDFEIKTTEGKHFIEVKGVAAISGGILFTNKEWEIAKQAQENYTICIVSNINSSAAIKFINDPYSKLNPSKNIVPTVQVQWQVSDKELQDIVET